MKPILSVVVLASLFPLSLPCALADDRPFPFDASGQQTTVLHLKNASPDDEVVALARAADVNVLMDVSEIPTGAPKLDTNLRAPLVDVMFDLVTKRNLRCLNFEDRTLLFWPSPDVATVGEAIMAQEKAAVKAPAPWTALEANEQLQKYFQEAHGWDGRWENVDLKVALDDLPADLQARVTQEIKRQLPRQNSTGLPEESFGSEEWQKRASLIVEIATYRNQENQGARQIPALELRVADGAGGHQIRPIADLRGGGQ